MQYLGGKSKIRKQLASVIESFRVPGQMYFEPFVGGGWVLQEISGMRMAADGNVSLIAMYAALQNGWLPPHFVSEDEWRFWRESDDILNPMKAFCGFGCSFGGKWFGGYARSEGKTCYAATSKRSLLKQLPLIRDVTFLAGDFTNWVPEGMLIYCDPPYAGTTNYGAFNGFDHELFWNTVRMWTEKNTVLVSEYQAPDDFECVAEFNSRMGLTTAGERPVRIERLFKKKD